MARMTSPRSVASQLRLIAGLRWRMFANSLRTRSGKVDLAGLLISGAAIAVGVLGVGVLLAAVSWAAFHEARPAFLAGELWFVFLAWQFVPIFVTGFGAQADLGILLRFPLSYPAFVFLNLAYGLLEPAAVVALCWLAMIFAGAALAAPSVLPWVALGLGTFATVNLLLNRAVFAWLDRWLAQRRTREILGVVFFLLIMSLQFIQPAAERWGKGATKAVQRFAPVESVFPPGMAASVIEGARPGGSSRAWVGLAGLGLVGLALAWALGVRLRAQYRGENLSESPRPRATAASPAVHEGWELGGLSPPVAALLEKDLRYLLRNTSQYLALAVPLILVLLLGLQKGNAHGFDALPAAGSAFFFPVAVAYCVLIVTGFANNALGYDGPGIAMLFAAPVRFRDVLIAKNLLHTLVFAFEALAVFVGGLLVGARFDPGVVALTLVAALFVLPLNFAVGNLVSLHYPRQNQFGAGHRQRASGMSMLINLTVGGATIGFSAGVFILSRWRGKLWIAGAVFVALAALALMVHHKVVEASSGIANRCRETLMKELCR